MKTRILAIILSVCLVGAIGWGFTNYKEIGELKYSEIQLQKINQDKSQQLERSERDLQKAAQLIDELEARVDYIEEGLSYAGEENDRLEREVSSLSENLEVWETAYDDLLANRDRWVTAYNDLLAKHNQLTEQMEDADFLQNLLQLLL